MVYDKIPKSLLVINAVAARCMRKSVTCLNGVPPARLKALRAVGPRWAPLRSHAVWKLKPGFSCLAALQDAHAGPPAFSRNTSAGYSSHLR